MMTAIGLILGLLFAAALVRAMDVPALLWKARGRDLTNEEMQQFMGLNPDKDK